MTREPNQLRITFKATADEMTEEETRELVRAEVKRILRPQIKEVVSETVNEIIKKEVERGFSNKQREDTYSEYETAIRKKVFECMTDDVSRRIRTAKADEYINDVMKDIDRQQVKEHLEKEIQKRAEDTNVLLNYIRRLEND